MFWYHVDHVTSEKKLVGTLASGVTDGGCLVEIAEKVLASIESRPIDFSDRLGIEVRKI